MTTSPPSGSEPPPGEDSQAFGRLHPRIQQWIYTQGWRQLRQAQERAAGPILAGNRDVIVAATTASGKTEAAWLPICSALLTPPESTPVTGVQALYVGPLKALINDQYQRLRDLCRHLELPVHRWHGDVAAVRKTKLLRQPGGILLITPESLEALFVNHGPHVAAVLGALRYIVVDELHAFLGTERGAQLQSLLHRIELIARRRIPRIALSATLGEFGAAAAFLRPGHGHDVTVIESTGDEVELRLQLRGYLHAKPAPPQSTTNVPGFPTDEDVNADTGTESNAVRAITDHLYATLRGRDNLVFANSRGDVEIYTDRLNQRCAAANVPTEFLPHHGNLSKELREHAEGRLKDRTTPTTVICTSTLEMGIDIGSVDSVAQLDAPFNVAGLRQRLGRSGRRDGQAAVLRMYVTEPELTDRTPPTDLLRSQLFQAVAMVELLLEHWYEPPDSGQLHLSTLIQQILSVIAQRGGAAPAQLYDALCARGPFARVDQGMFAELLRCLGGHDLITQDSQGLLLPGVHGERLINHYTFYTAFQTPEDYRLVAGGRTIGSMPVDQGVIPGNLLIFAGKRWQILDIDSRAKVIEVKRAGGGRPPRFLGGGGEIADDVRRRMRALYLSEKVPRYLDTTAQQLLCEGRDAFRRHGHATSNIIGWGADTLLFPWRGDRIMNTLAVVLAANGLASERHGIALLTTGAQPADLYRQLSALAAEPAPDAITLADTVSGKEHDKHDQYLSDNLLNHAYASRALDLPGTWESLGELLAQSQTVANRHSTAP